MRCETKTVYLRGLVGEAGISGNHLVSFPSFPKCALQWFLIMFTRVHNHQHCLITEHFHHPKKFHIH